MGIYTTYSDKIVDEKLDKYFNLIIEKIIDIVGKDNIKAIVLFGSFGRGEGGVIVENGNVTPVNDFDITIFVKNNLTQLRKMYSKELEDSAQLLSENIGIKQIDLDLSHPFTLLFAKMNNANYEMYNGNKILYGYIDIKKIMLKQRHDKIKLVDGANYFLTRGSGLVLAGYSLMKYAESPPKLILENLEIEINKAILAIGDSYLIKKTKYHYLYNQRIKHAQELSFNDVDNGNEIKKLYINALHWKLKPSFSSASRKIKIEKLIYTINIFSSYFLWFESKRLNNNFKSWLDYSSQIIILQKVDLNFVFRKTVLGFLKNPKKFTKNLITNKITFNDFAMKLSIMPLVLFAFNNRIHKSNLMLNQANKNLKTFYERDEKNDWNSLAEEYLNIFHPNGLLNSIKNNKKLNKK
tara:strand:+ start:4625 stop:5851 length:1227 start_codon:yes stop_codon:yes gene_type:complete